MNAIILVAGMGTRLYPLTKNIPKSLIKINKETFIERQIIFLKQANINNITLVTGYLSEKFEFLKAKYNIDIIHNNKFNIYNNIYSLYLVKDLLNKTYILNGDIYYKNNIFHKKFKNSTFISPKKKTFNNEWILHSNQNNKITSITISSGVNKYIMCPGAYFDENNSKFIKSTLEYMYKNEKYLFKKYYWEHIILNNLDKMYDIYLSPLNDDDIYEIDTLYEYYTLKNLIEKEKS